MTEAIEEICRLVESKTKSYVVPINVDVVVKMEKDEYLRRIVEEADLTLVDGQPLVWISKWHKHPVKEKVSGSDLVPKLCEIAAQKGYSVFLLGGAEGVTEKAKENLQKKWNKLNIAGIYSPPIGFETDNMEKMMINDLINKAKADILVVCFGCPKQEKWIYENYRNYSASVSICAGATVDYIAEKVKRAPGWMSNHGLEWFFRATQEPFRLISRYWNDAVSIVPILLKYK